MSHFCTIINATPAQRGYFSFGKSTGHNETLFGLIKLGVQYKENAFTADVLIRAKNGWEEFDPEGLAKLTRWIQAGNLDDYHCYCDADGEEPWCKDTIPTWYPAKGSLQRSEELDMWDCCGYLSGSLRDAKLPFAGHMCPVGLEKMQKFLRTHPLVKVIGLPE